ncbi:P-loop containing nucleoside triphosphate hydrolase protein [Amylocystis lapponica]|nr:P-loop containing nucleoside triphosphate hydrolase protein [Amylocystis lapponica]
MVAVCAELLSTGACVKVACRSSHDVKICRLCGIVCYSTQLYNQHLTDRRHVNRVNGVSNLLHCSICAVNVSGSYCWGLHIEGRRHKGLASQRGIDPDVQPEEALTPPGYLHCNVCRIDIHEGAWSSHATTRAHQRRAMFAAYDSAFEEAERDKNGVTISPGEEGLDFGFVELPDAHSGTAALLKVENTVPTSKVRLAEVKLSSSAARGSSSFSLSLQNIPRMLTYGRQVSIQIDFKQAYRGLYEDRAELIFEDLSVRQRFVIVRCLRATVGSRAEHEKLKPKSPYIPRKRMPREAELDVIPGIPPPASGAIPYVVRLPRAEIPKSISSVLSQGKISQMISQFRQGILPSSINSQTYGRHFKALLWAEEHRMDHDLGTYNISETKLTNHNQYYYLGVPGLAEKRPSVLVGDRIMVQLSGSQQRKWFEGYVHVVRREEVGLCLNGSFKTSWTPSRLYDIRFKLNRLPLRRQHQALDTAFHPERLLFPRKEHIKFKSAPSSAGMRPWIFNRLIAENPAQLQAVTSIANLPAGSPPFVLFGPPGTGKTITVVEAIRQILRADPHARILACAPSNSAADLIASRLSGLTPSDLFRFYAPSRFKDQVPDDLRRYSCATLNGHFSVPPMAILMHYRVIVSTCVSAGFAHGISMPRGHFTHIFFDEAGQATEPEVMIAIKTMADDATNVILSGDPKQLGPIIRSPIARELGLERSYIERWMQRDAYGQSSASGVSVVKLVQNFRSHQAILTFPNKEFYRNELQCCGTPRVINRFIGSSTLVKNNFPIVFHAIPGKDDREASSPSFFNAHEILQVREYVEKLKSDRDFRVSDADIGIISPYHAQCQRIRRNLQPFADGVKVGSVEEFQGQERPVIILSTVRSSPEFVKYDLKHTLGFVANPRRFNVAVTRAQALLIVVGDPAVLSLDPLWRSFLSYVHVNGGWRGSEPSWDTRAPVNGEGGYAEQVRADALTSMDDFARRMEMLTLEGVVDDDDDYSNVDRPWRDTE